MVVSLDEENKNARLSLRQSEILDELASDEAESRKAAVSTGLVSLCLLAGGSPIVRRVAVWSYLLFILNLAATCWNQRLEHLIELHSKIS